MSQKKIGISIGTLQRIYGDRGAIEIAARIGADSVDFATHYFDKRIWDFREPSSIYAQGDAAVIQYCTELRKYAESLGIVIGQTHGRGEGFLNNKELDDAQVENARLDLLAASALGADVCVVHNATSINHGPHPDPEMMRNLGFDQYTRMLPYAAKYRVKLATETFGDAVEYDCVDFFGDLNEFINLFDRIYAASPYREWFTVCMDTGHTNKASRFGNPKPADAIRRIGDKITALHLNDNDTLTDQHKTPMTGTIDWNDTLNALDEIGYNGIYNMELNLKHFGNGFEIETAEFAIKVMRHLLKSRNTSNR